MRQQTTRISPEDISRQLQYCREVAALSAARPAQPLAFVDTYGCQQNEADSERIRGYLREMGYGFTQDEEQAQIIVHQHLRHPGARGAAGAGQPGRPGPREAPPPGADHLRVRLHGPGAPCGGEDHAVLSAMWTWCSAPTRCGAFPSCSTALLTQRGRVFADGRRGRLHRRGHPGGARRTASRPGCPSCTGATTSAPTASCPMSGAGSAPASRRTSCAEVRAAGGRGLQGHHPAGPERELLRQGPGRARGLRRPAGAGERRARGLPHPLYDLPPQGRHPEAVRDHGPVREGGPSCSTCPSRRATTGCSGP